VPEDSVAGTLTCGRCGREAEPLPAPPVPGAIGREIRERVCPACWAEWQSMEVMVINELRLNFMDPSAQRALDRHMREFLALPAGENEAP
jgi:Fe-S cluster biosynthesis and repair protein YggX